MSRRGRVCGRSSRKPANRASEISRKEEILESKSGLITMAGGKLTAYRKMAEKTVDLVLRKLGRPKQRCLTAEQPLPGGEIAGGLAELAARLARGRTPAQAQRLVRLYGSEAEAVIADGGDIAAEARQAVRVEGAVTLEDYWVRRSVRAWFFGRRRHRLIGAGGDGDGAVAWMGRGRRGEADRVLP